MSQNTENQTDLEFVNQLISKYYWSEKGFIYETSTQIIEDIEDLDKEVNKLKTDANDRFGNVIYCKGITTFQ